MKPTLVEEPLDTVTLKTSDEQELATSMEMLRGINSVGGIRNARIIKEMSEAVQYLTVQNWPHIERILDLTENAKIAIGFSVEIDRSYAQPKVTTNISYAEKHKDKRETYIDDPRQTKMSFKDKEASNE